MNRLLTARAMFFMVFILTGGGSCEKIGSHRNDISVLCQAKCLALKGKYVLYGVKSLYSSLS